MQSDTYDKSASWIELHSLTEDSMKDNVTISLLLFQSPNAWVLLMEPILKLSNHQSTPQTTKTEKVVIRYMFKLVVTKYSFMDVVVKCPGRFMMPECLPV